MNPSQDISLELLSVKDVILARSLKLIETLTCSTSAEGAATLYSAVPAEDRNRATPAKKSATEINKGILFPLFILISKVNTKYRGLRNDSGII